MGSVKQVIKNYWGRAWLRWMVTAAWFILLLALIVFIEQPLIRLLVFAMAAVAATALFAYQHYATRAAMERRVQEYATLNEISLALRTTLDLDNLLTIIQQQVTRLLGVDNFYVALHDEAEQRIWFPLAVRGSQRYQWLPRPLVPTQLTDRVILNGEALVLKAGAAHNVAPIGLPPSEENPHSWMGVPLATLDRAFGCLAVFSYDPAVQFREEALALLNILSGQVSVAIENVLMYKREQRRATQMENLNRISALITASLDQEEVLSQVCRAVVKVGGGQRSAIFLIDPEKGSLDLARSSGLSDQFSAANASFSLATTERMRCLRSGRPVIVPDLSAYEDEPGFRETLTGEGIRSFSEFPMITPDGRIGYLAAYYDTPHSLPGDEVELLQMFASQAALAVSNARLYTHVDLAVQRRANQLAILENVSRELSAEISSDRLFDMILGYAMEFTGSIAGEFSRYNPTLGLLEVKSARGDAAAPEPIYPSEGVQAQAISTGSLVSITDLQAEHGYHDLSGGKARSVLCVPVVHEEHVLGVLLLESDRANAFSTGDQNFIKQIANQAAVSIVNADLYSSVQRRLREQSILYLVSQQLVYNPEFDKVLQTLARSAEAYLVTRGVCVYLWQEDEEIYEAANLPASAAVEGCQFPRVIPLTSLETIAPGLQKTGALRIDSQKKVDLLFGCKTCQALVLPLVAGKQKLGMLLIHLDAAVHLDEDQLNLLRMMVGHASTSLHNALLFADVSISHDRLSTVLNSVGEGILMVNLDGRIMVANELVQTLTGYSDKSLLEQRLTDLPEATLAAFGSTRQEAESVIAMLTEGRLIQPTKNTVQVAGRQAERVLERSTVPVWGDEGRQTGWMVLLRDVTEERQVVQTRELITSTLVHDLRSPVSAVISAVDILEEHLPAGACDDVTIQAFRVAHNGANRVLSLIESLLDIARMQAGKMELNSVSLHLRALVSGVLAELNPQAAEYGVILRNEVPEGLTNVMVDQSKLVRVIGNLVDNAMKFSPPGGQVVVSAFGNGAGMIQVEISDDGPGIPDEYREKVFDRFTQVPGARGRRRGSGLGLTFCRMAIEAHGGGIWVQNRAAPETGSIFTFTLPASSGADLS